MARTTKTTTKTVATPEPKKTAQELLEAVEFYLDSQLKTASETLRKQAQSSASAAASVVNELDCNATAKGARFYTESYWGMTETAEACGRIDVITKAKREILVPGMTPARIILHLQARMTKIAINDTSRIENSTDPIANAMAMYAGHGRGQAYRDLLDVLEHYADKVAALDVEPTAE